MSDTLQLGLSLGSKSNPVVLTLTEYEGFRLLDIRKHYLDKETKSLQPTRKGISLGAKLLKEVQQTINDNQSEIFEWLERGGDETLRRVSQAMETRAKVLEEEGCKARPYELAEDAWTGPRLFSVETHGAEDKIHLNRKHAIFDRVGNRHLAPDEFRELLGLILMSFYRAKLRFPGQLDADSDRFFDVLEFQWGSILQNYCYSKSK